MSEQTQHPATLPTVTSLAAAEEWYNKNSSGKLRCMANGREQVVENFADAKAFYQAADKPNSGQQA